MCTSRGFLGWYGNLRLNWRLGEAPQVCLTWPEATQPAPMPAESTRSVSWRRGTSLGPGTVPTSVSARWGGGTRGTVPMVQKRPPLSLVPSHPVRAEAGFEPTASAERPEAVWSGVWGATPSSTMWRPQDLDKSPSPYLHIPTAKGRSYQPAAHGAAPETKGDQSSRRRLPLLLPPKPGAWPP